MSIDDITKEEWDKVRDIKPDMVNKPVHYQGIVECITLIKDRLGSKGYAAYLEGNIWKYLYRHKDKEENIQDLKKCQWYLNELIKHYEEL
jgi:arylamine N-acetyltransferase|tara:strand:+ start:1619 stop:1888 length:270 start_codon:yes stop_codon:yes gene_type:complete